MAGAAADHARRPGLVLGCGDRAGADAAARLPPRPAPGRGLRRERVSAARAGAARPGPHHLVPARARSGVTWGQSSWDRSEEHTSEIQSRQYLVCRLLLEKKKK